MVAEEVQLANVLVGTTSLKRSIKKNSKSMRTKIVKIMKTSDGIDFKEKNGGSGWTRTTDLTLIRGAL